jgi:hypothetical protein
VPKHLENLYRALDYWHSDGRWDVRGGFNWIYVRAQARHPVRVALAEGDLGAYLFQENGMLEPIPAYLWNGTHLWGEADSSALVNVELSRGLVSGYLLVERSAVELFWAHWRETLQTRSPLSPHVISAVQSENPAIGVALAALESGEVDGSPVKRVGTWLREHWPDSLHAFWPGRDKDAPTPLVAKHIITVIRYATAKPFKWTGESPADDVLADLADKFPIVAAALEVTRLCRTGELDHNKGGTVLPGRAQLNIAKRTVPSAAGPLLVSAAAIAIPDDKVSGGGRARRLRLRREGKQ